MSTNRLPLVFALCTAGLKLILVVLWRLFQPPEVAFLLDLDPGAVWLAEKATFWLFDPRRIGPSFEEAILFEAALVLAAGVEGLAAGFLARSVLLWRRTLGRNERSRKNR